MGATEPSTPQGQAAEEGQALPKPRFKHEATRKLKIRTHSDGDRSQHSQSLGELVVRCVWEQADPAQIVQLDVGEEFEARPDGLALLQDHGAQRNVDWYRDYYEKDPNYLLHGRAFDAPPLKRMMHVYGINNPDGTPWSYVYKSRNGVELTKDGPRSLGIELDPDADNLGDKNHRLKDGILYETADTLQRLPDDPDTTVRRCGDGTVPYQSLRFTKSWDAPRFLSQVVEMTSEEFPHDSSDVLSVGVPPFEHRCRRNFQFINIFYCYLRL